VYIWGGGGGEGDITFTGVGKEGRRGLEEVMVGDLAADSPRWRGGGAGGGGRVKRGSYCAMSG
jgi:hypothetical protein